MPETPTHLDLFSGIPSEVSPSPRNGPVSAPSPSVKSTHIARKSSKNTVTQFLRTLKASDAEKQGRNNLHHQIQHGYTGKFLPTLRANDSEKRGNVANDPRNGLTGFVQHFIPTSDSWTDDDTEASLCSQQEFRVSPQARPGSEEAQATTVGSGRKLYESLVKHSRLGPCLKTLLASLLLSKEWSSSLCFLKWRASATKSRRRLLFQLVPSEPVTDATGSSLLPTLQAASFDSTRPNGKGGVKWGDLLPTLTGDDADNATRESGDFQSLTRTCGLKLTSAFCERFMGFPLGWTAIDDPESTH